MRISCLLLSTFWLLAHTSALAEPINIGSRLELFVDDYLIESRDGAELRIHHPQPKEICFVRDEAWEGSGSGYDTVFQDGDLYRMYYKAWEHASNPDADGGHDTFGAYAESKDGKIWTKPKLGIWEFEGSKENNIVWMGKGGHDFSAFRDTNPDCPPEEQYKAVSHGHESDPKGLMAFKSPDGIHWSLLQEDPIIPWGKVGESKDIRLLFDTQNVAFWDEVKQEYRCYIRAFQGDLRVVCTATSKDFRTWSTPVLLNFGDVKAPALYTNQVKPYYRAPHIYIGFPARYSDRGWSPSMRALPMLEHREKRAEHETRFGTTVTDSLLIASRDGVKFKMWMETFLRPGLRTADNWVYGDNYIAWHVVETEADMENAPRELSLYATESYWTGKASYLRRFTLRIDGFVSAYGPYDGGTLTTKPVIFDGEQLILNFSTSAAGSIRIELQEADGTPIPGFTLEDSELVFGDDLARVVPWKDDKNLAALAGKAVRIKFEMKDADLYSYKFE
ncbi:MAG: hypothetical protein L3K26_01795 [Candidatus Hydrogenedentes bacterium]|nr:hypothetical protein [Candidatus Hydrogenedentota bacterium]